MYYKKTVSTECREAILRLLTKLNKTDVVGLRYVVNEDEDGFTIEATEVIVCDENGEMDELFAWEYDQYLADELNELLFDFLDEFNGENDPADGEITLQMLNKKGRGAANSLPPEVLVKFLRTLGYVTADGTDVYPDYVKHQCTQLQESSGDLKADADAFIKLNVRTDKLKPILCLNDSLLFDEVLQEVSKQLSTKEVHYLPRKNAGEELLTGFYGMHLRGYLGVKKSYSTANQLQSDARAYIAREIERLWHLSPEEKINANLTYLLNEEAKMKVRPVSRMYKYEMNQLLHTTVRNALITLSSRFEYILSVHIAPMESHPDNFLITLHTEAGKEVIAVTPYHVANLTTGEMYTKGVLKLPFGHLRTGMYPHKEVLAACLKDIFNVQPNAWKLSILDKPVEDADKKRFARMVEVLKQFPQCKNTKLQVKVTEHYIEVGYNEYKVHMTPLYLSYANYPELIFVRHRSDLTPLQHMNPVLVPALQQANLPSDFAKYLYQIYVEATDLRKKVKMHQS